MSVLVMSAVWQLKLPRDLKIVLLAYADHADDDGFCRPSMDRIGWKCGYSRPSIKRKCQMLREQGLLEIHGGGNGRGDPYHVRVCVEKGVKLGPFKSRKGFIPDERGSTGTEKGVAATNPGTSVEPSYEPSLLEAVGTGTAVDRFSELWRIHPRGAKPKAHAQYLKATHRNGKPPKVTHEILLRCLKSYVATELRPGFSGHDLERWIRDERWEQELAKSGGPAKGTAPAVGTKAWLAQQNAMEEI